MAKRFPHLDGANAWPGLDTVDPFDLQVTFDPYLWSAGIELHLCRVRHDVDYSNIINWTDAATRDAYYDRISDRSFTLESEIHVEPGQEIKLPVPLDVLQGYNFLFIDFPAPPVEYGEKAGPGGTRYYYFIDGTSYRSPSTTAASIVMDQWTTHCTELDMRYISLERGHAPLAAVDADLYLADPIRRCEHITIPDEVPASGGTGRIKHVTHITLNAGQMLACLAFDCSPLGDAGEIGQAGWRTPQSNFIGIQGAYGHAILGMAPGDVGAYLDQLYGNAPQIVPCIQACFVIDRDWVDITSTRDYHGVTVYELGASQRIRQFVHLDRAAFGYPARYAGLAKLYTSPYAWIEVTGTGGGVSRIRVEDTDGNLRLSVAASLAYPGIGIDACILGIGDDGEYTVGWNDFDGHAASFSGDWASTMRHFSIPTYLITQDPSRSYWYRNYWQIVQNQDANATAESIARNTAAANYGMRIAGIERSAARLSQQQASDNAQLGISTSSTTLSMQLSQAKLSDDATEDSNLNSTLSAIAADQIALASSQSQANGMLHETAASVAQGTAQANVEAVRVGGDYAVASSAISGITGTGGQAASMASSLYGQTAGYEMRALEGGLSATGYEMASGAAGAASMGVGLLGNGLHAIVDTAATMNASTNSLVQAQGAADQATLALAGARMATAQAQASYNLAASNNTTIRNASFNAMWRKVLIAQRFLQDQANLANSMSRQSTSSQHSYQTSILNGDNALARSQAATTKGLADAATTAQKRLQDASIERAARTAALGTPIMISPATGASVQTTTPMAMIANVKTLDDGAIAAAGDAFLTYGYRYAGRQWEISTLLPMTKFSYWEGDVKIGGNTVTMDTYDTIRGIFADGVFVWDREESIGSTSIYDNERRG